MRNPANRRMDFKTAKGTGQLHIKKDEDRIVRGERGNIPKGRRRSGRAQKRRSVSFSSRNRLSA
jgi:hypothetical protein